MDIEKLTEEALSEAEDNLHFITCSIGLINDSDWEKSLAEINVLLQRLEKIANATQEKVTTALVMRHCRREKEKASA